MNRFTPSGNSARFGRNLLLAVAMMTQAGCAFLRERGLSHAAPYRPDNVFQSTATLSHEVKRVAVLPLACDEARSDLSWGRDALDAVMQSELVKTKKFEVVVVTPELLRASTGRTTWSGDDVLPRDFLSVLREAYGCDAVLFSQLTVFRAHSPLAVGWRLRLVDARNQKTLWAGDEVFDAGRPAVIGSALQYQRRERQPAGSQLSEFAMMNSPRCFGQYAVAELLATLPAR